MKYPRLFGRAKNGKIKEWCVEVVKMDDGTCNIETEHGYEGGKKQRHRRSVKKGKNIGRSNETTVYEQACLEAASSHRSQKDSGYVENREEIPAPDAGFFLPMLADRYDKHKKKLVFPCMVQPKLDGVRMLARKEAGVVSMWSRMGKPIDIPTKIKEQLTVVLRDGECTDGELYVHGWTFQRVVSAVKKSTEDTDLLEYHIYDMPHPTEVFSNRIQPRNDFRSLKDRAACQNIKLVKTMWVPDQEYFDELEQRFLDVGYEGMMARNAAGKYTYRYRSYDLLKVKRFVDNEYEIVGGKDGTGKESGLIIWKCKTESGLEFFVRPEGTAESRKELFEQFENHIGKMLTVRYQELTDDGIPRFPVGVAIRDYE